MASDRVWYAAYGSNVNRERFSRYLASARDPSPPTADFFSQVGLRLRFGNRSTRWNGGGVAFVFPDPDALCWVRAWNITTDQFEDVFAQENRLPIGTALDWTSLSTLADPAEGQVDVGNAWYRRILGLDLARPGADMALTFTAAGPVDLNPPSPEYRATIEAGLADNPDLDPASAHAYLEAAIA